jgi:hypothetical protein
VVCTGDSSRGVYTIKCDEWKEVEEGRRKSGAVKERKTRVRKRKIKIWIAVSL